MVVLISIIMHCEVSLADVGVESSRIMSSFGNPSIIALKFACLTLSLICLPISTIFFLTFLNSLSNRIQISRGTIVDEWLYSQLKHLATDFLFSSAVSICAAIYFSSLPSLVHMSKYWYTWVSMLSSILLPFLLHLLVPRDSVNQMSIITTPFEKLTLSAMI